MLPPTWVEAWTNQRRPNFWSRRIEADGWPVTASVEHGRGRSRDGRLRAPSIPKEEVVVCPLHGREVVPAGIGRRERRALHEAEPAARPAEDLRCDREEQLVDEITRDETAEQMGAALAQDDLP